MRLSKYGWVTYKEIPKEAEIISHQLMLRAGLIHKVSSGIYHYLPMAHKVLEKIKKIIREEMDAIDAHEITMSVVTPADLWKETGRWDAMAEQMAKFKDRSEREMCLSPTNEESVTDIFRKSIQSYKQLPLTFYQINTKFRDEIRPRFGIMRGREFCMKDAYSFHLSKKCFDEYYDKMYGAYEKVLNRLRCKFLIVEADGGTMATSDSKTHEFQIIADSGEDTVVYCTENGYAANQEKAKTSRPNIPSNSIVAPLLKIETVLQFKSIELVSQQLNVPITDCLKAVIYKTISKNSESLAICFLLGDDEINEIKLKSVLSADHLTIASDKDLDLYSLHKGFIGPAKLNIANKKYIVLFDEQIKSENFYVVGANEVNYHFKNFNLKRDYINTNDTNETSYRQCDLRLSKNGDYTEDGKFPIELKRGIEIGHIFQLGKKYTEAMKVTVLDEAGKPSVPLMGCYGIGASRLIAAVIEQSHDDKGIIWPLEIAPYQIYFCRIIKDLDLKTRADECYLNLKKEGFEVLYDDRDISPGIMFKDADLIGLPIRVVFGEREFKATSQVEIKVRVNDKNVFCSLAELVPTIKNLIKENYIL